MTMKELEQLPSLRREIQQLTTKMNNLQNRPSHIVTDSVRGSARQSPYQQHITTITGLGGKHRMAYAKAERTLKDRLRKVEIQVDAINNFIATIDQSDMRQIIDCRFLQGLTWEMVASNVYPDKDVGEDAPRKALARFLKKFSKVAQMSDMSVFDVV